MKSILFVDAVCYKPYDYQVLENEPLGGTEGSVLRLARAFAATHKVHIYQPRFGYDRSKSRLQIAGIEFLDHDTAFETPSTIIHVRSAQTIPDMAAAFPEAKHVLWLHDLGGPHIVQVFRGKTDLNVIEEYKPEMIFVSEYHKLQWYDRGVRPYKQGFNGGKAHVCYNIVDVDGVNDASRPSISRDPNRILFASSPHKGLKETIATFNKIRNKFPEMRLVVANPGYMDDAPSSPGVSILGSLSHKQVMEEMRKSLCVFSCNTVYSETFGLVYAEANGTNTPFLTHKMGALHELTDNSRQFVDTRNIKAVIERLESFIKDPVKVGANPKFNVENVLESWRAVLR